MGIIWKIKKRWILDYIDNSCNELHNRIREDIINANNESANRINNELYTKLYSDIYGRTRTLLLASKINAHFEKYRNIYTGKDIVIVGGGPTAKLYNEYDEDKIYIAINSAFKDERIKFDFIFAHDEMTDIKGIAEYKIQGKDTKKMIALHQDKTFEVVPQTAADIDCDRFVLDYKVFCDLPYDISVEPLADIGGTVFSAFQFALFTNPRAISLVGFDCTQGNIYSGTNFGYSNQLVGWRMIKEYANKYWPNTRIITVNPIGLKGYFEDVYTDNYSKEDYEECKRSV